MLDRDEIKKRLKGVDPQLCAAFAARCSLRVLPLLVTDKNKEAFWYWNKTDQYRYVLTVLTTQRICINISAFGRNVYATNADANVKAAARAAYTAATDTDVAARAVAAAVYTTSGARGFAARAASARAAARAAADDAYATAYTDSYDNAYAARAIAYATYAVDPADNTAVTFDDVYAAAAAGAARAAAYAAYSAYADATAVSDAADAAVAAVDAVDAARASKTANINLEIEIIRDLNNITNEKSSFFSK